MDATVPSLADIKFDDKGLVPAIVQDADTGEILMMAWMNEESLNRTLEQGTTWFWSRSRQEFWNKGATSGNLQHVTDVRYDCDGDVLLVKVHPDGPACHTGERTCFFRSLTAP
jgi:phosphoribosyl-AMP cyclohydrolase